MLSTLLGSLATLSYTVFSLSSCRLLWNVTDISLASMALSMNVAPMCIFKIECAPEKSVPRRGEVPLAREWIFSQ